MVNFRYQKEERRQNLLHLLLGTELESETSVSAESFPAAQVKPTTAPRHGHQEMDFPEVPNRTGEAHLKFPKKKLHLDEETPEITTEYAPECTPSRKLPRSTQWYQSRALKVDSEREERGQPPVKRHMRIKEFYACGKCGLPKNKETGHSQSKGRWFCPREGITLDEWKASLPKKPEKNVQNMPE